MASGDACTGGSRPSCCDEPAPKKSFSSASSSGVAGGGEDSVTDGPLQSTYVGSLAGSCRASSAVCGRPRARLRRETARGVWGKRAQ